MSSIIVLDSSDEDEAPSKKSLLQLPQNSTTITLVNKPKQTSAKKQQQQQQQMNVNSNSNSNSNSNISKKQQNIISNNLLSPTALTTTIAKPKVSTLPKINAAFTLNTIERHTPTPPKTNITNITTASAPISMATAIPVTITPTTQRKRKTPTPPKPVATTVSTGGNTMLLSTILQQNAAAGVPNLANLTHLSNMANMLPMIQSVQSMAPSSAPPMQLLATPTSMSTPMESLAAIDPRMMHNFSNNRNINPVDNFKIHLPLKRPNSAVSSSSAANSPNSRNSPPATTAAALRSIKRVKPTTLLKHSDEAWQKRQQKTSTSLTSSSAADDDLIEVFPPISPASSTATASASLSPAPAYPIASPKPQVPQMPKLHPAPKQQQHQQQQQQQQTRPRLQAIVPGIQTSPSTAVTTATTRIQTPPVKTSAVLDLTDSPERQKVTATTSNVISPPPPLTPKTTGSTVTTKSATSSTKTGENSKAMTPEIKPDSAKTTENNVEKDKTPPREPIIPDYEELIKVCRIADPSDDMEKLINRKLIRYYYSVHPDFLRSRGFRKQLRSTIERINSDPELVYYNLKTIVEELKVRRKSSQVIVTNDETSAAATGGSTGNKRTDEQIKKLNKALYIVTKRIEQLEESEVDWDDDDSTYLQVERFKRRACQIYEKICDLTGESKSALRLVRKPIQFSGTSFPQFNRTLQAYVNQTKEFPDYHDVIRMLEHCNGLYSLGLAQFEMKRIAQDAFIKVGKLLQSRRKTDLYETVAHYTANAEDPAEKDSTLMAKLSENQKKCTKIGEIIEKFAREQDLSADDLKEAKLKKSAITDAENSKGEGAESAEGEKKVDEDDDEDEDDEEDDDDEPAVAAADIEEDAERLTNGDITDEDSDVDSRSEIKKKKSDIEKAEPATITDDIKTSNCTTATATQTIVDTLKKNCDINTKVNDIATIESHNSNISNEVDSLLITNKNTNMNEIRNKNEIERKQTSSGDVVNVTVKDKEISIVRSVQTVAAQIPNGKVASTIVGINKPTSAAISTTAPLPTPTAASLKIISVSSLNESVNKVKSNNAAAISPSPSSAKQRTVAEIVISDEES